MNPKLSPLEKTSVQVRQGIKRLEVFTDTIATEQEKKTAEEILKHFHEINKLLPRELTK